MKILLNLSKAVVEVMTVVKKARMNSCSKFFRCSFKRKSLRRTERGIQKRIAKKVKRKTS